jgi:hypothetical protein
MKNFTIELKIDGKKKKFTTPSFIKGSLFRRSAEIAEDVELGRIDMKNFDTYLQFVTEVFGEKFNIDDLENGIDSREMTKTIYATTAFVMGQVETATKLLNSNVDDIMSAEIDEKN